MDRQGGSDRRVTGLVSTFPSHRLGKQTASFELSKANDKKHVPELCRKAGAGRGGKAHEQTNHPKISAG